MLFPKILLALFKSPFRFYPWFALIFFSAMFLSIGTLSALIYFLIYPAIHTYWEHNALGIYYNGNCVWPAVIGIGVAIFIFLTYLTNYCQIKNNFRKNQ